MYCVKLDPGFLSTPNGTMSIVLLRSVTRIVDEVSHCTYTRKGWYKDVQRKRFPHQHFLYLECLRLR